jgi:c-di-GMP-binding flagellar brake protein YcgR
MKVINESVEYNFGFSYARNISSGGLALETKVLLNDDIKLDIGSILKLKFKIPGGKLYISIRGSVTRIEETDLGNSLIGIKFENIPDDFKEEIDNFVKEIEKGNLTLG